MFTDLQSEVFFKKKEEKEKANDGVVSDCRRAGIVLLLRLYPKIYNSAKRTKSDGVGGIPLAMCRRNGGQARREIGHYLDTKTKKN